MIGFDILWQHFTFSFIHPSMYVFSDWYMIKIAQSYQKQALTWVDTNLITLSWLYKNRCNTRKIDNSPQKWYQTKLRCMHIFCAMYLIWYFTLLHDIKDNLYLTAMNLTRVLMNDLSRHAIQGGHTKYMQIYVLKN